MDRLLAKAANADKNRCGTGGERSAGGVVVSSNKTPFKPTGMGAELGLADTLYTLEEIATQMRAMLTVALSEGFNNWVPEIRNSYFSAARQKAVEIEEAVARALGHLDNERQKEAADD